MTKNKKNKILLMPLKQLFDNMFNEMKKTIQSGNIVEILKQQNEKNNHIDLIMDLNFDKILCFIHYMNDIDNPEHICKFVLSETHYIDGNGNYSPLTQEHQRNLQKFCDLFEKDGFKFIATLKNNMILLWSKDSKIINKNNFDAINNMLENKQSILTLEKYCELKNISKKTFYRLKKKKMFPHIVIKQKNKHKKQFIIINPYKIIEIKSDNGIIM